MKPIAVSLFTGIGGFDLGAIKAGFDVRVGCEIDTTIASDYNINFPDTPILGDIKDLYAEDFREAGKIGYKDIDLVIGGSPCQGFSQAGQRNPDDPRNSLIWEYVRLIEELQPNYFIFENVKGFTDPNNKAIYERFINSIDDIGYNIVEPQLLDCSDYGVPQKRKRLFILGYAYGCKPLFYPEKNLNRVTLLNAIADMPIVENYERLRFSDRCMVQYGEPSHYVLQINDEELPLYREITASRVTKHDYQSIVRFKSMEQGYSEPFARIIRPRYDQPCETIVTKQRILHPIYHRYLTPREAARVQSFPDTFRFNTHNENAQKEVGNSVPPLMAKQLCASILDAFQ